MNRLMIIAAAIAVSAQIACGGLIGLSSEIDPIAGPVAAQAAADASAATNWISTNIVSVTPPITNDVTKVFTNGTSIGIANAYMGGVSPNYAVKVTTSGLVGNDSQTANVQLIWRGDDDAIMFLIDPDGPSVEAINLYATNLYPNALQMRGAISVNTSNQYDIGSALFPFRSVYAGGGSYYVNGVPFAFTNAAGELVIQADVVEQTPAGTNPPITYATASDVALASNAAVAEAATYTDGRVDGLPTNSWNQAAVDATYSTNWIATNVANAGDVVAANYNEFTNSNRFNSAIYTSTDVQYDGDSIIRPDGSYILDSSVRVFYDSGTQGSIDFENRLLTDNGGNTAVDWAGNSLGNGAWTITDDLTIGDGTGLQLLSFANGFGSAGTIYFDTADGDYHFGDSGAFASDMHMYTINLNIGDGVDSGPKSLTLKNNNGSGKISIPIDGSALEIDTTATAGNDIVNYSVATNLVSGSSNGVVAQANAYTDGRVDGLPTNSWNQAATDATSATNRLVDLEGRSNTWNQAAVDATYSTNWIATNVVSSTPPATNTTTVEFTNAVAFPNGLVIAGQLIDGTTEDIVADGSLYMTNNSQQAFTAAAGFEIITGYQIDGWTNITITTSNFTLIDGGFYELTDSASFSSSANNSDPNVAWFTNGVRVTKAGWKRTIGSTAIGSVSAASRCRLPAGTVIDQRMDVAQNATITWQYKNWNIRRLRD